MRIRTLLGAGVILVLVRCGGGDEPSGGDDGSSGNAGDGSSGSSGSNHGGAGGASGGTNGAGEAGEVTGGSSGATSGRGGGGSGATGMAGAGGDDAGDDVVSGHVTTLAFQPVEGALVAIGSAIVTTDENGYFAIPNVAPEYDLVLVQEDEGYALVVRGASTRILDLVGEGFSSTEDGLVMGVLTGGAGVPLPDGHLAFASFLSPRTLSVTGGGVQPEGDYGLTATWYGGITETGDLLAIGFDADAEQHPVSYDGFGTKRITLRGGDEHGAIDGSDPTTTIALEPIGERWLTGNLSAPDEFVNSLQFFVGPLSTDYFETPAGDYSTLLPVGAGNLPTYVQVESLRELVNGTEDVVTIFHIDDSATDLDLSSPSPPALLLPEEAELDIDAGTSFTWTKPPNSVATISFAVGDWTLDVVTTENASAIPDLSEYGVTLGAGEDGQWRVHCTLGVDGVDAWAEAQRLTYSYRISHDRSGYADSGFRTFTLAQ